MFWSERRYSKSDSRLPDSLPLTIRSQVEGTTWQRHRKITTPPFNERNSGLVWKESLRQAIDMQIAWIGQSKKGVTSTSADTMTLALHVLTAAGFGQSYSFSSDSQKLPQGHALSYRNALCEILTNFVPIIIFNHDLLRKSFMPKALQRTGLAIQEFKMYMSEMISRERQLIEKRDSGAGNLLSSLIRASEDGKAASQSLDDEEIMGNLFIYSLAGHETTANTLAYAIMLLSVNPSLQDWLHEELLDVFGNSSAPDTWQYETNFPRLKRCLTVMLETLRYVVRQYFPFYPHTFENALGETTNLTASQSLWLLNIEQES